MRIGVMSDSHGDLRAIGRAVEKLGHVDLILHAGDYYQDAMTLGAKLPVPVIAVGGNCDLMMTTPRQHIGNYSGFKLLLIHGHQYGVKRDINSLFAHAQKRRIDIVVYGHTHVPHVEIRDGIHMFNPGSVAYPRIGGHRTCGILTLQSGEIDMEWIQIDHI